MLRTLDVVMIGLLLGGAAFTFKVKQDSEAAIEKVTALQKKIEAEQDAIDILKADWSLLTDPKRLKSLVERYKDQLDLEPLDPGTIGEITEIPVRPPQLPEPDAGGIAGIIDAETDPDITTGTIAPETSQ